jgi:hypothetical protein
MRTLWENYEKVMRKFYEKNYEVFPLKFIYNIQYVLTINCL